MPQQSMFGGWAVTDLSINVHLNHDRPGGRIEAAVLDQNGKQSERFTTLWQKDRDVSDLGSLVKAIAEAFLWGPAGSVSEVVRTGVRAHLPEVPTP